MKVLKRLIVVLIILLIIFVLGVYAVLYSVVRDSHKPYIGYIEKYSEENNIEKELTLAIMKVESSFNEKAVSHADAEGLMQITPETAKWLSEKMGEEYTEDKMFDPEQNIKYGTYYLKFLRDYYKSEDYAIIAYNAGIGNVDGWIANNILSGDIKDYENIPFAETRNYIKKVREQYRLNKKIYDVYYADMTSSRAKIAFNLLKKLSLDIYK